jgi:hypothetical protein
MAGNAIHHAHESMHQRTGKNESRAVHLARLGMRRLLFVPCRARLCFARIRWLGLLWSGQLQNDHAGGNRSPVSQQRNRQLSGQFFSGIILALTRAAIKAFA